MTAFIMDAHAKGYSFTKLTKKSVKEVVKHSSLKSNKKVSSCVRSRVSNFFQKTNGIHIEKTITTRNQKSLS